MAKGKKSGGQFSNMATTPSQKSEVDFNTVDMITAKDLESYFCRSLALSSAEGFYFLESSTPF